MPDFVSNSPKILVFRFLSKFRTERYFSTNIVATRTFLSTTKANHSEVGSYVVRTAGMPITMNGYFVTMGAPYV